MSPAGLPIVKPRELIRALERMGFRLLRKSGQPLAVRAPRWPANYDPGAQRARYRAWVAAEDSARRGD